jgi:hypothetical protein
MLSEHFSIYHIIHLNDRISDISRSGAESSPRSSEDASPTSGAPKASFFYALVDACRLMKGPCRASGRVAVPSDGDLHWRNCFHPDAVYEAAFARSLLWARLLRRVDQLVKGALIAREEKCKCRRCCPGQDADSAQGKAWENTARSTHLSRRRYPLPRSLHGPESSKC